MKSSKSSIRPLEFLKSLGSRLFSTGNVMHLGNYNINEFAEKKAKAKLVKKKKLRNKEAIKLAKALQEEITIKQLENIERRLQKPAGGIKLLH